MVEQLWGDQDDIATLHEIAALLRRGDAEAVDNLAGKVDSCATHTIFPTVGKTVTKSVATPPLQQVNSALLFAGCENG